MISTKVGRGRGKEWGGGGESNYRSRMFQWKIVALEEERSGVRLRREHSLVNAGNAGDDVYLWFRLTAYLRHL